jgi:hypothetical protein
LQKKEAKPQGGEVAGMKMNVSKFSAVCVICGRWGEAGGILIAILNILVNQ